MMKTLHSNHIQTTLTMFCKIKINVTVNVRNSWCCQCVSKNILLICNHGAAELLLVKNKIIKTQLGIIANAYSEPSQTSKKEFFAKTADLVTFTEEILIGKLNFLCSDICKIHHQIYITDISFCIVYSL